MNLEFFNLDLCVLVIRKLDDFIVFFFNDIVAFAIFLCWALFYLPLLPVQILVLS